MMRTIATLALAAAATMFAQQPRTAPRLERLAKDLNLTEDQKSRLAPILKVQHDKMADAREQAREDRRTRRDQMSKSFKDTDAKIREVLTPEQAAKLDEMRNERRDGREGRRRSGRRGGRG